MKKLFYLFLVLGLFACSSDSENDNTNPINENPVYLDSNGVTIKARDWAVVGDSGIIDGVEYIIVDEIDIYNRILNSESLANICTTKFTDINNLLNAFQYQNLHNIQIDFNEDVSSWDVSNVTNMHQLFSENHSFNQDLSYWDVSNVTNMYGTFSGCYSFNQDISSWNVSNVTNMKNLFGGNFEFNQDISSWNVSNVTDMSSMFSSADAFNQDIGDWDVSNVTDMSSMFHSADSFNQDIGDWNVSNVTNMNDMFRCTYFNQNLSSWDVSNVTSCEYFCCTNCGGGTEGAWTQPQPNFTNCN